MQEEEFIPTRQSLLSRLKNWDDEASWKDFFNTYWKLIYAAALKSGLVEPEAQDVVQETVISVAKKMREFKYDPALGSFKGWLLLITQRRITDHLRKKYRQVEIHNGSPAQADRTATIERVPDPSAFNLETIWDEEWQKNLVAAALARVKNKVRPQHYQIFDCYALKKWPAGKVAKTLGVNVALVYLIKHRVASQVKKEIQLLEKDMF